MKRRKQLSPIQEVFEPPAPLSKRPYLYHPTDSCCRPTPKSTDGKSESSTRKSPSNPTATGVQSRPTCRKASGKDHCLRERNVSRQKLVGPNTEQHDHVIMKDWGLETIWKELQASLEETTQVETEEDNGYGEEVIIKLDVD